MSSSDVLQYSTDGGVATLTLNRPDKRNALNGELVGALDSTLAKAEADGNARVVLIRGAGKDFCSGADLAELERIAEMGREESHADATRMGALFTRMRRHAKPVVAAVHGRALAGGCGLATACDVILMHEHAEMGYPEVHLGFIPALVMTILRRKVSEARAFELVTLGDRVSASDALAWGLATRILSAETFEEDVAAYVGALARRPPSAVALSKQLLYELDGLPFEEGIARAAEVNVSARMTEACREGVRRFLARSKT